MSSTSECCINDHAGRKTLKGLDHFLQQHGTMLHVTTGAVRCAEMASSASMAVYQALVYYIHVGSCGI